MPDVTRRAALRAGLASVGAAVALAGCTGTSATTVGEGFEADTFDQEWETAAAVGPEVDVAEFEWAVARSREQAREGEWSLEVFTEGDYDDGTAWATREIPVERGTAYEAAVSLYAWSPSESFNTLRHLVARLGPDAPESEDDFPDPGMNTMAVKDAVYGGLREPLHLAEGWREYRFEWRTPELETDRLHLSAGVSVVWESDATHYVDDVRAELRPL